MYENGKEYYTLLVQSEVGCEDSMEDPFASIEEKRNRDMDACAAIVGEDPSLVNNSDSVELDFENAESMLERLKAQLCDDFPTPCESCCEICTIDSALSDALAPAFYITAPLDDYTNNTVYINTASDYSDVSFFLFIEIFCLGDEQVRHVFLPEGQVTGRVAFLAKPGVVELSEVDVRLFRLILEDFRVARVIAEDAVIFHFRFYPVVFPAMDGREVAAGFGGKTEVHHVGVL